MSRRSGRQQYAAAFSPHSALSANEGAISPPLSSVLGVLCLFQETAQKWTSRDQTYKDRIGSAWLHRSALHNLIDPLFGLGVQLVEVLTIQIVLFRCQERKQQSETAAQRQQHAFSLRQNTPTRQFAPTTAQSSVGRAGQSVKITVRENAKSQLDHRNHDNQHTTKPNRSNLAPIEREEKQCCSRVRWSSRQTTGGKFLKDPEKTRRSTIRSENKDKDRIGRDK